MTDYIDKSLHIPLYNQVMDYIKNQIETGELKPGSKLMTEHYYAEFFGVSRITVRKALNELERKRIIVREKSKSPIVAEKKVCRDFDKLEGLGKQIKDQGKTPRSEILHFETVLANEEHAKKYKCDLGDELFSAIRVRYADDEIIAIQNVIIIKKFAQQLTKEYLETGSLYGLIRENGYNIEYAKQIIGADTLPETLCNLTGLKHNTVCILSDRITYLDDDRAAENSISYYIASRYNIKMTLYTD